MHLNTVVSVLVSILRGHTLGNRCEGISQLRECLALCALLGCQFLAILLALALYVFESLIDIYEARGSVIERTACVELSLHD